MSCTFCGGQDRTPKLKAMLSILEVAELTGWSRQTVTRVFEVESGVLILERPASRNKRPHRTITIPRGVYERVIRRLTVR